MTTKFIKIYYKYIYLIILVFLISCDIDRNLFFKRELSDESPFKDQRTSIDSLKIDTLKYIEDFQNNISKDFTRYHFDIYVEGDLKLGDDSMYIPVFINNIKQEYDYYGLWLLNLKTLKFESKFKLDSNTSLTSNDIFRKHRMIIVSTDTLIYLNFDYLRVINFNKNKLLYEDSSYDSKKENFGAFYNREELITFQQPYIYSLYDNSLKIRNIITKEKDSIFLSNSFETKNFICNQDSIILFGYNKLQGTNQTCIFDTQNQSLSFHDLNINIYNDNIDIIDLLKLNKSILILTNLGLYEYSLNDKLIEKIINLNIQGGELKISNNMLIIRTVENHTRYITKYNLINQKLVSKDSTNEKHYLVSENVYISEGGTSLYIVNK